MPASARPAAVPPRALWAAWGVAAVALAGLTAAAGAFPLRLLLAAACAAGAAVWAWVRVKTPAARPWAAAAPVAAWTAGVGGWPALAAIAAATLAGLWWTKPVGPALPAAFGPRDQAKRSRTRRELNGTGSTPDPDQYFTRTTTPAADAAGGAILVPCEAGAGGGEGHVLFWPPFAGVPTVECYPADGVGRVRAACVLPHGVRFEVVRPADAGPARVCFEATWHTAASQPY